MKKLVQTLLVTLFFAQIFVFQSCDQNLDAAASKVTLSTIEDTIAYGIGVYSAGFFKQSDIENPNLTAVYKGLKDALDSTALFTDEQFSQIAQEFFQAQADKKSGEVKEKGKKFLEENASKDGVLTTASACAMRSPKIDAAPAASSRWIGLRSSLTSAKARTVS